MMDFVGEHQLENTLGNRQVHLLLHSKAGIAVATAGGCTLMISCPACPPKKTTVGQYALELPTWFT